jgi:large subunit ribosomal protein L30e
MIDFDKVIKTATKSGRLFFGVKKAMAAAQSGRAVAVILSSSCPPGILRQLQHHAALSNLPVHLYPSPSADLGLVCGKPFAVSAVTIRTLSDSSLLKALRAPEGGGG